MKKIVCNTLVFAGALLLLSSVAVAAECSGAWSILPNYIPGSGGACAALGLNTHQAVCQPGQKYATYCDDTSGGRYRICQSNVPCYRGQYDGHTNPGFRDDCEYSRDERWISHDDRSDNWHYRGYRNNPRDDRRNQAPACTQWDYNLNRPCAAGTVNRDCRNGCDGK